MTTFTTRTVRLAIATGAALAVLAPAAQAKPLAMPSGPAQASTTSVVRMGTYTPVAPNNPQVPDRVDRLGGATQFSATQLPPDRVDQLGTSHGPTVSTSTLVVKSSGSGFDWVAAAIGAGSALAIALIAGAGLAARGRRRVALSS